MVPQIIASLDSLDDHLAYRTFLIGHDITAADWIVWGVLKGMSSSESSHLALLINYGQAIRGLSDF